MIVLRPWAGADAPALAAAWNDPEIARWTGVPADRSVEAAARWIAGWDERRRRGSALDLVVAAVDDQGPVLGEVGAAFRPLPPSVGWWTAAAFRGRGYATRAVRLFCGGLLASGAAAELVADVDPANAASLAVARHAPLTVRDHRSY